MSGGLPESWARISPVMNDIAAKFEGEPCAARVGPEGAGHFVKTVHNGIEYADMQMIAEIYSIMRDGLGLPAAAMSRIFADWNRRGLSSYLVEITAIVLAERDPRTREALVDVIIDAAGQKGTGRWSVIAAQQLGVGATTLEAAKIVAYAQGYATLAAASKQFGWNLPLGEIARIWRAGCIIRSVFLQDIARAFDDGRSVGNLLQEPYFAGRMKATQQALRSIVAKAVAAGIPVPALSASLAYFDDYRRARGSANLIQAQRDLFGAHTFRRLDEDGAHHHQWPAD
jgi:6-phosphogluconate dehydrogenase